MEKSRYTLRAQQKFDVDSGSLARNVIAKRRHGIARREFCSHLPQRIARSRGDDAIVGFERAGFGLELPAIAAAIHFGDPFFFDLRTGALGTL